MMYCSAADMEDLLSVAVLIQLTDDEGLRVVHAGRVEKAISDASAEINAYCAQRYTVPIDPVPDILRKISVDIAAYNLHSRRKQMPDDVKDRYKTAVAFLRAVSTGTATLGVEDPHGTPAPTEKPRITGPTRIFSRDKLGGW